MGSTTVLNAGVDALLAAILDEKSGSAQSGSAQSGSAQSATESSGSASDGTIRVLDLGGGTGGQAVRIASLGHDVTVVDPSLDALAALDRRAGDAGVADRLRAVQGDAEGLGQVVEAGSVDLVVCHGVLEVVDDPEAALAGIAAVLRARGRLSLLIHQREAAVLSRVAAGQIRAAAAMLSDDSGSWGPSDPLRRRFSGTTVSALLDRAGFEVLASDGLRMFSDLAPDSAVVADGSLEQVLADMDLAAAVVPALRAVAPDLHLQARRR